MGVNANAQRINANERRSQHPSEFTQEQWGRLLERRNKRRRVLFIALSVVLVGLTAAFLFFKQGFWGKVLSALIVYASYYTIYSRSRLYPYPGLTRERVGANKGEPKSTAPVWVGFVPIAIMWAGGGFPAKPVTARGEGSKEAFVFRKIWVSSPLISAFVLFLSGKLYELSFLPNLLIILFGASFWLYYWPFMGWPAVRYILGGGNNPDVFITWPEPCPWGQEIGAYWAQATKFDMGRVETRFRVAVHWDPGVMAIGGGRVHEPMVFPWIMEWFPRAVLEAGQAAKARV